MKLAKFSLRLWNPPRITEVGHAAYYLTARRGFTQIDCETVIRFCQDAKMPIAKISRAIQEIKAGKMIILTDSPDRENEGDLVVAAEHATPEIINFMATHGRGLICVPLPEERLRALGIRLMVLENRDKYRTAFTVSVDAAPHHGVSTGISAFDRAKTIQVLIDEASEIGDLNQPGHIFPLQAKPGGVLQRAGHTEAALDLAMLAGLKPGGVICEILNENGTMARQPDLEIFAKKHDINIYHIADLIEYRRKTERLIRLEASARLPSEFGEFDIRAYSTTIDNKVHVALVKGKISPDEPVLVRVHSECMTGDVFASTRCDCGPQLMASLELIEREGKGVLVYMRQEGRGIGLIAKLKAYGIQDQGLDTVEANEKLGFPPDLREYGIGAQILADIGVQKIRLMTNNPRKIVGLEAYGLTLVERVPIQIEANAENARYLQTKMKKMGHLFTH